jgi:TusA-related sulfurtransferase
MQTDVGQRKTTRALPTIELDLKGQVCPGPTVDTLMALKRLPPGGKVVVTTDYVPARQTIGDLAKRRGHSFEIVEDDGTTFRIEIVKGRR